MPYEGELMMLCPPKIYDFTHTWAVVVSGAKWNPCGHLLLCVGGIKKMYFHVAGSVHGYPRYMDEEGYRRYLKEQGKRELKRFKVEITDPEAAMLKLEFLTSAKWTWGIFPHNCATFVEEIVHAGGSKAGLYLNCPRIEKFD